MKKDDELKTFIDQTIKHYDTRAEGFWQGTRDHDVSQNIQALLRALGDDDAKTILDVGCGPGRDLMQFTALGHEAVGLDGSIEFVNMAAKNSGCEVWHQNFLDLALPENRFDGIFANASLFHIPIDFLPAALLAFHKTLKSGGAFFSSNPRGNNQEGMNGDRFGCYHDYDRWQDYVTQAGFVEIEHYYRPEDLPREQQPWLATVWRKND